MMSHDGHDHSHAAIPIAAGAEKTKHRLVPVTILTGYLGSGKTTLLNHILNDNTHGMKFAIIENEFGDVNVDERVLSDNVNEEIVEVMNGCICCSFRYDLVEALETLYEKIELFDGVIIETTGLADPSPVVQTFFLNRDVQKNYRLDSVITVVDAYHILDRIQHVKKREIADEKQTEETTTNEAVEQLAFADKIILNKMDLVQDDAARVTTIEQALRAINPSAPIVQTQQGRIDPREFIDLRAFDVKRILQTLDPSFLTTDQQPRHDKALVSVPLQTTEQVNLELLQTWIQQLVLEDGDKLFRYKGVIAVKGMNLKFVFQGVGMLFQGAFQGKWKKSEKRETRFIFIGKHLDAAKLRAGFAACYASHELRFAVGDTVQANVGEYIRGTVIKHWDQGNAYRIELENGRQVWAAVDVDNYVRRA